MQSCEQNEELIINLPPCHQGHPPGTLLPSPATAWPSPSDPCSYNTGQGTTSLVHSHPAALHEGETEPEIPPTRCPHELYIHKTSANQCQIWVTL